MLRLKWIHLLALAIPAACVAKWGFHAEAWVFVLSCLGIIPLAKVLGEATEVLASRVGPGLAGMLNAGLGNLAELLIAFMALMKGHPEVVKASLTGSIIGNTLLVFGLAAFVGGLKREQQSFSRVAAASGSALLMVMATALLLPSILVPNVPNAEKFHTPMSVGLALVLVGCYAASLLFSLRTHKQHYAEEEEHAEAEELKAVPTRTAIVWLVVAAGLIALLAEFLASTVDHACTSFGFSKTFVGVIVVAIVGNAAEHGIAIVMAAKDRMNLAVNICLESSKQVAIFVAPLLVFAGLALGKPMDLVFPVWHVAAVWSSCLLFALICADGKSNWLEGVCLTATYLVVGVTFYFIP